MMTERDVLREIESALDVSPSHGFEARVREQGPKQAMHAPRWTLPAVVALAATLVLAVMLVPHRQGPDSPVAVRPDTQPAPAAVETINAPEPTRPVNEGRPATPRRPRRSDTPVTVRFESPEVVVPAGQMAAIQRLVDEVARGRVVMAPERPGPPDVLEVAALAEAAPITFDPIRFDSLSADESPDLWR